MSEPSSTLPVRLHYLAALAALVLLAGGAVWVARRTDPEVVAQVGSAASAANGAATIALDPPGVAAPPVSASGWLNTEPLNSEDLAGKVVLYDFWTFGCINCRNTLSHVKAWYTRYAPDGLVVLSVHTPEFSYEAEPAAVAEFVAKEGITYPVALDPDKKTWRAFSNRFWPAFYLHDRDGKRRYDHFGEGAYDTTEDTLRALLGVDPASPRAVVEP